MSTSTPPSPPHGSPHKRPIAGDSTAEGLSGLAERVCRYFLDFLETDFKRQQAPRRKVQGRSETGLPTSINLRKYPKLYSDIWKLATNPIKVDNRLTIRRGSYTAHLSPILRNLVKQHVEAIEPGLFHDAIALAVESARNGRATATQDIEKYLESVSDALGKALDDKIIAPLLALLDEPVRQQAYSAVDSIYEIEGDLVEMMLAQLEQHLIPPLNRFVISGDLTDLKLVLDELLDPQEAKQRLLETLEHFVTSDLYQELRDLHDYLRTLENGQFYLYFCDIRFEHHTYPVCYLPLQVEQNKENGEFLFAFDPHLYVNKRAVDYVLQELARKRQRVAVSPIEERICYLEEGRPLVEVIGSVVGRIQGVLDLDRRIEIPSSNYEVAQSTAVKLTNGLHVAVFDRSDESLINDYERLLTALHENEDEVHAMFHDFVRGFVLDEPVRVVQEVEDAWRGTSIPDRLVASSPIPLNEEQRKAVLALKDPRCRFLVLYGPPGTGKSHTITAIAFDCILQGKSVLILSDKQEALEVVQDKLTTTLKEVRKSEDFQDPILRLGKTGGTYTQLVSTHGMERIRQQFNAARVHETPLANELAEREQRLKEDIRRTVEILASVELGEIEEMHRLEAELKPRWNDILLLVQAEQARLLVGRLDNVMATLSNAPAVQEFMVLGRDQFKGESIDQLLQFTKYESELHSLAVPAEHRSALLRFSGLRVDHAPTLSKFIEEYDSLRMPLFGFLFRGARLREVHRRFGEALPATSTADMHKQLDDLHYIHELLQRIDELSRRFGPPSPDTRLSYDRLAKSAGCATDFTPLVAVFEAAVELFKLFEQQGLRAGPSIKDFGSLEGVLQFLKSIGRFGALFHRVQVSLETLPKFDALAARAAIERLQTQRMAHEMDGRFLRFIDGHYTTAKALAGVIRRKQPFPVHDFGLLKDAFPCIIAGIREFAEYIPLKPKMFDIVIIDEASQVSVAQAFPALLRAKQVVVLGDRKQFSNVKAANASNALNQSYLSSIQAYCEERISRDAQRLQRFSQFDVKRSILEFFELVANCSIMLRKHFRGYQELISFSSRYFYGNGLQAIKVRGKPIDEVIQFTFVDGEGKRESHRNMNTPELEFIRECLDGHLGEPVPPSVGIITPFREQQQLLTRELFKSPNAQRYEDKLRLKIMTFDTCQGEERDMIYYSMVATREHDALNYVLPVDLENAGDRVDEAIKMQRLNVALSRAREGIHFVLSKPIDTYRGSALKVLQHYQTVLDQAPSDQNTDPSSPMEKKVFDWISKTAFFQRNLERLELIPQFPIGDYLRQLDPLYEHPRYRVDFLLRYRSPGQTVNVVVEYDGFQEHFVEHGKIHEGNYERYYRPEDVERQMVLESYGYKFLRVNRFNIGSDPIDTLSERLYALVDAAQKREASGTMEHIGRNIAGLEAGMKKLCSRCHQVKDLAEFFDPALRSGAGGQGRVCISCKKPATPASGVRRSSYSHWRRRYR